MMMKLLTAIILAMTALQACAASTPPLPSQEAIDRAMAQHKAAAIGVFEQAQAKANALEAQPHPFPGPSQIPKALQAAPDPAQIARQYQKLRQAPGIGAPRDDLLVFVSFSMPKASLDRLARDCKRTGAAMVFRGFVKNNVMDTVKAFKPLAKLGAGALIDPPAFERYKVKAVPEFMLAQAKPGCQGDGCYDHVLTVEGDVSMSYALRRMAQAQDALSPVAQARLARLEPGREPGQ